MGVEYKHYLVPHDRRYSPPVGALARLIEALRRDHWVRNEGGSILQPGVAGEASRGPLESPLPAHVSSEWLSAQVEPTLTQSLPFDLSIRLLTSPEDVEASYETGAGSIRYPFAAGARESVYHDVYIHLAGDFVDHGSEVIEPLETTCPCGQPLGYYPEEELKIFPAIEHEGRVRAKCPKCGTPFDPNSQYSLHHDGFTGEERRLRGGCVYHFAVIVDCGKGWPRDVEQIQLAPDFKETCEAAIGTRLDDFHDLY